MFAPMRPLLPALALAAIALAGCVAPPPESADTATLAPVFQESTCFLVDGPTPADGKIPLVGEVWHDGTLEDSKGALVLVTTGAGEKHYWDGDLTGMGAQNGSTLPRVLARAGYAVMPYDRLGQGESPYAGDDKLVTADINARHASAILGLVRAGDYVMSGDCGDERRGPAMDRVYLGGHSIGALISMSAIARYGGADGGLFLQFSHYLNPDKVDAVLGCVAQDIAGDPLGETIMMFCPGEDGVSPECIEFTVYKEGSTEEAWNAFCANEAIHPEPRGMAGAFAHDMGASKPAPVGGVPLHFVFGDHDCATNGGAACDDATGNEREVADWTTLCACPVTQTTIPAIGHDYVVHHNQWMVGGDILAWLESLQG